MRILFLSSEVVPFSKTGGLADVAGALPAALRKTGHDVVTVTPLYPGIRADLQPLGGQRQFVLGEHTVSWRAWFDNATSTVFIDAPELFGRKEYYTHDADEHERWAFFNHLALVVASASKKPFDIIHCNDWQTGLAPLLAKTVYAGEASIGRIPSLITVHNLGYQGRFDQSLAAELGLGDHLGELHQDHLSEGYFSFLEAGLLHADRITTVSPTYAEEIQTPEGGAGLDSILRQRTEDVVGILNGIDTEVWNPLTDQLIPYRYSHKSLWRKEWDKEALLEELGLPYHKDVPVLGMISRLAYQKGIEIMGGPLFHFLDSWDVRVVVLGSGQPEYESFFHGLQQMNPDKVAFVNGYDNRLSHLIEAGADIFMMPSLYEPSGLNQMYSLAYGTIPVVRRVGGLADTVVQIDGDGGTGFLFDHFTPDGFGWALGKALELHIDRSGWKAAQIRGMAEDNSWEHRAAEYADLYRDMAAPPDSSR